MSISEEHFYMKRYESSVWHQTTGNFLTQCSHCFPSTYPPLISGDVSGETHGETQPRAVDCTSSRGTTETEPKPGPGWSPDPGRERKWRVEPNCRRWEWSYGQKPTRTEPEPAELPSDRNNLLSIWSPPVQNGVCQWHPVQTSNGREHFLQQRPLSHCVDIHHSSGTPQLLKMIEDSFIS